MNTYRMVLETENDRFDSLAWNTTEENARRFFAKSASVQASGVCASRAVLVDAEGAELASWTPRHGLA